MRQLDGEITEQFTSSPRHAVQGATKMEYYENLAKMIGCYPSLFKVLAERPSALRHAFFTTWSVMQYRLVGHGASPDAARIIDEVSATTDLSCGASELLNAGPSGRWPNATYFRRLFDTMKLLLQHRLFGFDASKLPQPKYILPEHKYAEGENLTREQNANVSGSRSE